MIYVQELTPNKIEALVYDTQHNVIFTGHVNKLRYYDLHSFEKIGVTPITGNIRKLGVDDRYVYALLAESDQAMIIRINNPTVNSGTDPINFQITDMKPYSNQDRPETGLHIQDGGATYMM